MEALTHISSSQNAAGSGALDLLVSLTITAALIGVTIPISQRVLRSSRLHAEARLLAQSIDAYATIAKLRDLTISVAIYPDLYQAHKEATGGELLAGHKFIDTVRAHTTALTLYPSGALSPETIELRSDDTSCAVIVALRGRTRVNCTGG